MVRLERPVFFVEGQRVWHYLWRDGGRPTPSPPGPIFPMQLETLAPFEDAPLVARLEGPDRDPTLIG